jgi:hypothetical protein
LRRTIQTVIEDSLSDALLGGDYGEGDAVHLDYIDEELVITRIEAPETTVAEEEEAEPDEPEPVLTP